MNRESFESQYQADWNRLEDALTELEKEDERARRVPDRADPLYQEFPELYRRVCHQLSLVRSRLYGTDLEQKLNGLVLRGHHQLYRRTGPTWRQVSDFVWRGFPRLVRREAKLFWVAFALFYGPLFGMAVAVHVYPELVYSVIDPETAAEYQTMYDENERGERGAETDVFMFGFYIYNNVSVAFRTFAGGILFALGSIFFLVFNGVSIGTVAGHMVNVGNGDQFFPFVIGHGSFELTAIVLAGASGLKLGLSVLSPGRLGRRQALVLAGRESIRMVYGIFGLLVVAAFLEAFWSPSPWFPAEVKYAVGTGLWIMVAAYFLLAGRRRAA